MSRRDKRKPPFGAASEDWMRAVTSFREDFENKEKRLMIVACKRRRSEVQNMIGFKWVEMHKEGLGKEKVLALNDEMNELRKELRYVRCLLSHLTGKIDDVPEDPGYHFYPAAEKFQDVHKLSDEKPQPDSKKRLIDGSEKVEGVPGEPDKQEYGKVACVASDGVTEESGEKMEEEIKMVVAKEDGASHEVEE